MTAYLPVEHELIDGARYTDGIHEGVWMADRGRFHNAQYGYMEKGSSRALYRLARPTPDYVKVAEYRPAPTEPIGLGAVVMDASRNTWVRHSTVRKRPWQRVDSSPNGCNWDEIQPVTHVLSEGAIV